MSKCRRLGAFLIVGVVAPIAVVSLLASLLDPYLVVSPTPQMAKPAYLVGTSNPAPYYNVMKRITNDAGLSTNGVTWGAKSGPHKAATDEPWNADNTLVAIDNPDGSPPKVYLDTSDMRPKYTANSSSTTLMPPAVTCGDYHAFEDRWNPAASNVRINVSADGTVLEQWNIATPCVEMAAKRFTTAPGGGLPFAVDGIGPGEGIISSVSPLTGSLVALVEKMPPPPPNPTAQRVFVLNMDTRRVGASFDIIADCGLSGTNACVIGSSPYSGHVTISESGAFVILHYPGDHPRVLMVDPTTLGLTAMNYSLNPETTDNSCFGSGNGPFGGTQRGYIHPIGHGDTTFWNGFDWYVGQEKCGLAGTCGNKSMLFGDLPGECISQIIEVRLADGKVAPLTLAYTKNHAPVDCCSSGTTNTDREAFVRHVSARSAQLAGVVVGSYEVNTGAIRRNMEEIVVASMRDPVVHPAFTLERWGPHYSVEPSANCGGSDWCEAKGQPNANATCIIWRSNYCQDTPAMPCAADAKTDVKAYMMCPSDFFPPGGGGGGGCGCRGNLCCR